METKQKTELSISTDWINIDHYGIVEAKENVPRQLQNFVAHVGAKDKYHHTLTIVAIQAVYHFMQQSKADDSQEFIIEFSQLKNDFKALIGSHYSFDVFNSAKAKTDFLAPDLISFD